MSLTARFMQAYRGSGKALFDATYRETGLVYYVIYADNLAVPSASQVKLAKNALGASAISSGSGPTTGIYDFTASATGLTAGTGYKVAVVWSNDIFDSNVAVSASFSTLTGGISFRSLILARGLMVVLPIGEESTGKKPIVLLDGELKERATTEGLPVILDAGALRTLAAGETLIS